MTNLLVYDSTEKILEKISDMVDERPADILEVLLNYIPEAYDISIDKFLEVVKSC